MGALCYHERWKLPIDKIFWDETVVTSGSLEGNVVSEQSLDDNVVTYKSRIRRHPSVLKYCVSLSMIIQAVRNASAICQCNRCTRVIFTNRLVAYPCRSVQLVVAVRMVQDDETQY
jgi:hypothetical protein